MSTDGSTDGGQGAEGQGTNNQGQGAATDGPKSLAEFIKSSPKHQEDLNKMMAENRRNIQSQNQDLVKQLEQLKQSTRLTQDERDELQTRITQLEEQYLSKEELAKREQNKLEKKYTEDLQRAKDQQDTWKRLYSDSTIQREWQDAAIAGEVLELAIPQVVEMFRHRTSLVERLEDGNPTGTYAPVVKFNDISEDGSEVVLDLSPTDAIKRMKELPEKYGNLFKGTAVSGAGESGSTGGLKAQPAFQDLMKDPAKYAKWRKENPDLPIEKLRR